MYIDAFYEGFGWITNVVIKKDSKDSKSVKEQGDHVVLIKRLATLKYR